VQVVDGHQALPSGLTEDDRARIVDFLDSLGIGSMLFVPLGAGTECLGNLVLTRSGSEAWPNSTARLPSTSGTTPVG